MSARRTALALALAVAGLVAAAGGCTSGLGDCPAASSIKPNGACADDNLDCPYTLTAPASCAGTATSCVCTSGAWACPAPTDCSSGEGGASEGGSGPAEAGPSDTGSKDAKSHG